MEFPSLEWGRRSSSPRVRLVRRTVALGKVAHLEILWSRIENPKVIFVFRIMSLRSRIKHDLGRTRHSRVVAALVTILCGHDIWTTNAIDIREHVCRGAWYGVLGFTRSQGLR